MSGSRSAQAGDRSPRPTWLIAGGRALAAASWLALLLFLGGVRLLSPADAGLRSLVRSMGAMGWAILGLGALGILLTAATTVRSLARVAARLTGEMGRGRVALALGLAVVTWIPTSTLWGDRGAAMGSIATNLVGLVVLLLLVDLLGGGGPNARPVTRPPARRVLVPACAMAIVGSLAWGWFVTRLSPAVDDEGAYLYQARLLAEGHLTNPRAPQGLPPLLRPRYVAAEPADWSAFPPGWPAVLTLGAWGGVPWLLNPVMAAGCVAMFWAFARLYWGRGRTAAAVALLVASPLFLALSGTYMPHTLTLLLTLVTLVGWRWATRSTGLAATGGLSLALLFLTRPLDGLAVVAAVGGLWLLRGYGLRVRSGHLAFWAAAALGPLAFVATNHRAGYGLTEMPMDVYFERYEGVSNRLGFGPDRGVPFSARLGPGHSPAQALVNLHRNLHSANQTLWPFPGGATWFLALGVAARRPARRERVLVCMAALTVLGYGAYWYHGVSPAGPRFYFTLMPLMVSLCHWGAQRLAGGGGRRLGVLLAACMVAGGLAQVPALALEQRRARGWLEPELPERLAASLEAPAIVLVPPGAPSALRLQLLLANDLGLGNRVLFARHGRPPELAAMRQRFPDRHVKCLVPAGRRWEVGECAVVSAIARSQMEAGNGILAGP